MGEPIVRNLAMELVRVTEAAAMAAARFMGRGDKVAADQAAVDAMRRTLAQIEMDGTVIIGEGEKDEAPMLFIGERLGTGEPPKVDIAVDPIDGTTLLSKGLPNAISVVALAAGDSMLKVPHEIVYMDKIAVGPEARGAIDIAAPVALNLKWIARAKGVAVPDLTVVILDRERHEGLIREVREAGARIKLISDGDVAGGVMAATVEHSGIDVLMGVGGAPEAVITACALKCLGGDMQCRFWPRNEGERSAAIAAGFDPARVYGLDDLVASDDVFFASTGVTSGEWLQGVRYVAAGATTQSIVMRSKSGTVRWIDANHNFNRLDKISEVRYGAQAVHL
jgi:fructose-1,6-bisphosphatase II